MTLTLIDAVSSMLLAAQLLWSLQGEGGRKKSGLEVGPIECQVVRQNQFPEIPRQMFQRAGDGCGPVMPKRVVESLPGVER